ncbi:LAFE_0E13014g1_1 [Lachancea fermentati]|uniref:LAFE_0E13014g1_1 n=1 Tax=Lachancea fermentati TaxID=4955 RepID=A0A1G4MDX9_LACFM|nr:LAFE_0E13014g1_1 [Lachancea fermentati]
MPAYLLPTSEGADWTTEHPPSYDAPNPRQILRIALNLKFLIDEIVPIIYTEEQITCDHSRILNSRVLKLARQACGGESDRKSSRKYQSVMIFCLLKVCSWYWDLAACELHNAEIYLLRATTAQQLCKLIIEEEEQIDLHYTLIQMLCRRYVINENDLDCDAESALELAMDMHCTIVIGSSGYQRCLKWLWRGWIVQNRFDPSTYVLCEKIPSYQFTTHFHPDRLKTPMYQNILEVFFSVVFLILYTIVVNSKDSEAVTGIDVCEGIFYFFTIGSVLDEVYKVYHVGWNYVGFWNAFNDVMYSIIITSMGLRIVSVSPIHTKYPAAYWDKISYRILSCAAPLVWSRLLLYLESSRFVGALLVVLKHMMKESIVFFFLLLLMTIGFLQGFLGLDSADGKREITWPIMSNLVLTVLGEGGFDMFENFAPPYAAILYYAYCFIVTVILLNILIALYSTAYQKVIDNALDEYMALMAQKTLRYIRAPDEDVYVPPFNIIELIITPFMHLMPRKSAKEFSNSVMMVIYFPMLVFIAMKEVREARRVAYNRMKKLDDDANETDVAWDLTDGYVEEDDEWIPNGNGSGIAATQRKNRRSLQLQREAENVDPSFKVKRTWYKEVKSAVQPVEKGFESGIGWENYDIYRELSEKHASTEKKVEDLTNMVKELTNLVKELKIEQTSK